MAYILPERLQQGIQESLPVIPNNGNPGGANNMPAQEQEQQSAPPDPYAWLQPSPYMDFVTEFLRSFDDRVDAALENTTNPEQNQLYNHIVRDGTLRLQPLNDFALPLGNNDFSYELASPEMSAPQYVPILPGE